MGNRTEKINRTRLISYGDNRPSKKGYARRKNLARKQVSRPSIKELREIIAISNEQMIEKNLEFRLGVEEDEITVFLIDRTDEKIIKKVRYRDMDDGENHLWKLMGILVDERI